MLDCKLILNCVILMIILFLLVKRCYLTFNYMLSDLLSVEIALYWWIRTDVSYFDKWTSCLKIRPFILLNVVCVFYYTAMSKVKATQTVFGRPQLSVIFTMNTRNIFIWIYAPYFIHSILKVLNQILTFWSHWKYRGYYQMYLLNYRKIGNITQNISSINGCSL